MKTRWKLIWVAVAPFALGATFAARPIARADEGEAEAPKKVGTLSRLESEMNRTGDVGVVDVGASKGSGTVKAQDRLAERPENKVTRIEPDPSPPGAVKPVALPEDLLLSHQYEGAFNAVERCRFDVARRRLVPPGEIQVGAVTFRWRIDPSGNVHDMRADIVAATDKDVIKCAETVLANWTLLNPVDKPTVIEKTHVFRKHVPGEKLGPVRVGSKD